MPAIVTIEPAAHLTTESIIKELSVFGEIDKVGFEGNGDWRVAYVCFSSEINAKKAASKGHIQIDGKNVSLEYSENYEEYIYYPRSIEKKSVNSANSTNSVSKTTANSENTEIKNPANSSNYKTKYSIKKEEAGSLTPVNSSTKKNLKVYPSNPFKANSSNHITKNSTNSIINVTRKSTFFDDSHEPIEDFDSSFARQSHDRYRRQHSHTNHRLRPHGQLDRKHTTEYLDSDSDPSISRSIPHSYHSRRYRDRRMKSSEEDEKEPPKRYHKYRQYHSKIRKNQIEEEKKEVEVQDTANKTDQSSHEPKTPKSMPKYGVPVEVYIISNYQLSPEIKKNQNSDSKEEPDSDLKKSSSSSSNYTSSSSSSSSYSSYSSYSSSSSSSESSPPPKQHQRRHHHSSARH